MPHDDEALALLMGFRPNASPVEWLAAAGLLLLLTLALTWLAVALGLVADRPETASNLPMPLSLQPFTPVIETLRGLLMGTPIGRATPRGTAATTPRP